MTEQSHWFPLSDRHMISSESDTPSGSVMTGQNQNERRTGVIIFFPYNSG